jgi:hypothetical protein
MFSLLFGVGVALLIGDIGDEFFRVMLPIVSIVSSEITFVRRNLPAPAPKSPLSH